MKLYSWLLVALLVAFLVLADTASAESINRHDKKIRLGGRRGPPPSRKSLEDMTLEEEAEREAATVEQLIDMDEKHQIRLDDGDRKALYDAVQELEEALESKDLETKEKSIQEFLDPEELEDDVAPMDEAERKHLLEIVKAIDQRVDEEVDLEMNELLNASEGGQPLTDFLESHNLTFSKLLNHPKKHEKELSEFLTLANQIKVVNYTVPERFNDRFFDLLDKAVDSHEASDTDNDAWLAGAPAPQTKAEQLERIQQQKLVQEELFSSTVATTTGQDYPTTTTTGEDYPTTSTGGDFSTTTPSSMNYTTTPKPGPPVEHNFNWWQSIIVILFTIFIFLFCCYLPQIWAYVKEDLFRDIWHTITRCPCDCFRALRRAMTRRRD